MFTIPANRSHNGGKRVRLDPLNSSNQQNGSHKGLLERLNSDGDEITNPPTATAHTEPRHVDMTAAFFGKQRRPVQQIRDEMAPPPPRPVQQQPCPRPCRQDVQHHERQRQPVITELQVAKDLREELAGNIATESSHLYSAGLTELSDVYKTLKGLMASTDTEDDRVLALVESNHKTMAKSLSEIPIRSRHQDETNPSCRTFPIGEEVASVNDHVEILETQVKQLWDAWEAADQEVQAKVAEMTATVDPPMGQSGHIKDVQVSLAREMKVFDTEAESIIEESHEEARTCEKEFGKKIHGAMSALLQQYLLED
ncbi:hypothetical protein Daus18300_007437 [Diaporthe australafricana]|uniref:Uncharacterized protein n=1 Tax=Diaporthe australafricana TaxID=127596 RepID=A0ABR3WN64_9PEZI